MTQGGNLAGRGRFREAVVHWRARGARGDHRRGGARALLLFGGSDAYTVKLRFINAAQLVKGNVVDVGGTNAGLVKDFALTRDGQAEVEIEVDERYAPLRVGTRAQIRSAGQTSVSGRYVQLMLPPENEAGGEIQDGGVIGAERTTTNVDIDQFFSIFDPPTRKAVQNFYKGGRRQYEGRGDAGQPRPDVPQPAARGLQPAVRGAAPRAAGARALPRRLVAVRDRAVRAPRLARSPDREPQPHHPRARVARRTALAEAIGRLPPFMRRANTTYVNLRSTLDELDPFVEASKPVAKKLRPYLAELRPFAREAVPTVRRLSQLARFPGPPQRPVRAAAHLSAARGHHARTPSTAAWTSAPAAAAWARPAARSPS